MEFQHKSIMLSECISGLAIKQGGVYVDCTLGGGGHSLEICACLLGKGTLIGIDQDINAIEKAGAVLEKYADITIIVKGSFFNIENILKSLNINKVDGFLLDLGVSSHQLDQPTRGFSYMNDAPLDMRMDITSSLTAKDVVNKYQEKKLSDIIYKYGEERWASRIAKFIVGEREKAPIKTTYDLVTIIKKAVPKGAREDGPHPAKRTFQAIRIEVNNELGPLEKTLKDMAELLNEKGRICVITFHSLEDRIVKNVFKELENPCNCPPQFPHCICNKKPIIKIITKRPITPTSDELEQNHRARSAKLRIGQKI